MEPKGAVSLALTLLGGTRFITWRLFRGMSTEPEAFLEPLGMSGLRPCAYTHLKKLCVTLVRSVERTTNANSAAGVTRTQLKYLHRYRDFKDRFEAEWLQTSAWPPVIRHLCLDSHLSSSPAKLFRLTLYSVADDQHRQAGLEPRLVPDLPIP